MFEARTTAELVSIASAGGGFEINAGARQTAELVSVAAAAAKGGAKVIFRGLAARSTAEIVSIASAGKGAVSFGDRQET